MVDDNRNLEERVAIVAKNPELEFLERQVESQIKRENKDSVETTTNLQLEDYAAVIISIFEELGSNLTQNYETPVIYFSKDVELMQKFKTSPQNLPDLKMRLAHEHNLFMVSFPETIIPDLKEAIEASRKVRTYLANNNEGREILSRQEPPRFLNSLEVVNRYYQSLSAVDALNRDMPVHLAQWMQIVHWMMKYDETGNPSVGKKIAQVVDSFLDSWPDYKLQRSVHIMGEGETGESSVVRVKGMPEKAQWPWTMFREIEDRGGMTAKQISEQRSLDSKHMGQYDSFRTALILRPLHFTDFPDFKRNTSFIIMQDVPSIPLYKALLTLNEECMQAEGARRDKIHLLRKSLLEKYVDDCAFWVNHCRDTIFRKPRSSQLKEYYKGKLEPIPEALTQRTRIKFDDTEKELWKACSNVLGLMNMNADQIVRNRDSSLANVVLHGLRPETSADEMIEQFGVTSKQRIDLDLLNEKFFEVDMQWRYGHVLEDLAQIATFYEAQFILQPPGRFERAIKLRDRYLSGIEDKEKVAELKSDPATTNLMFLYRAVRKMHLFTDYWIRTCQDRYNNEIDDEEFEDRRTRFAENIEHHAVTAKRLCNRTARNIYDSSSESIPDEIRELVGRAARGRLTSEQYLDLMQSGNFVRGKVRSIVELASMRHLLTKIADGFKNRDTLIYCSTKGDYHA